MVTRCIGLQGREVKVRRPSLNGYWWRVRFGECELVEITGIDTEEPKIRHPGGNWIPWHSLDDVDYEPLSKPRMAKKVITVRMAAELHSALKREASDNRMSLNDLCLAKLNTGLD